MILLDMDGVLVDFHTGFAKEHGVDADKAIPGHWDFVDAFPQLRVLSNDDLYKPLEFDFWSNLGWMHDGKQILQMVEDLFGRENIVLCTAPTANKGCMPGKIEWIHKNLDRHYHKPSSLMIAGAKHIAAHSGNLLIDDHDKNYQKFLAHGGKSVLLPRLWNSMHPDRHNALSILQNKLSGYIGLNAKR